MTKVLILVILFSTAVRAVVLAKLVILGISSLTSFILSLIEALVATLAISGILSSILLILALFTASLNLFKSTETGTNLPTSIYLLYFSNPLD